MVFILIPEQGNGTVRLPNGDYLYFNKIHQEVDDPKLVDYFKSIPGYKVLELKEEIIDEVKKEPEKDKPEAKPTKEPAKRGRPKGGK